MLNNLKYMCKNVSDIQKLLLFIFVVFQIFLWSSYYYVLKNKSISKFWGNIPKNLWFEFLAFAGVALVLNMMLIIYFILNKNVNDKTIIHIIYATMLYYGIQIFFLPIVELFPKIYTRVLLFVAILPVLLISYYAYKESLDKDFFERIFLLTTGFIPLYHVIINDAIRYGLYF